MAGSESNPGGHLAANWSGSALPNRTLHVPEHELIRCIGQGSYGQVWLARNSLGVYRAVKIVFRDAFESDKPFGREWSGIRKFEPISRSHEGFIDILQVGMNEERGFFYYIMEVGDDQGRGQSIDPDNYVPNSLASEIKRRRRISLQECLQLGMALSHALAELHKHGLVHRDIKPSNIMFVGGVPKLADIGLVALTDEARSYVGTEGFIPPEGPGTPQADIFSLGKVLYEAGTGNDRNDFPELPGEWAQSLEYKGLLELNEVIVQACQPATKDRYRSAWDMHSDLLLVVNGKSLKRLRQLERRWATVKRSLITAAVALGIGGLVLYQIQREWRERAAARQRQVSANVAYGNRSMESGDLLRALPFYAEALRLDQGSPTRERTHRLRFGSTLAQCPKLTQMWFVGKPVQEARFSPDGKNVLLVEFFGKPEVHDLDTGRLVSGTFGPKFGLRSAVYSPDGRFILTTSESDTAIVWDASSFAEVVELPHTNKVFTGGFSPDGERIITACKDGLARIWDARTARLELALPPHADAVLFAGFSHDGKLVVTGSRDGVARVFRASDGQPITPPLPHPTWVTWAAFSPDDESLVTSCEDHQARMWDVGTGRRIRPDLAHNDGVESVEFSPDGRIILTASIDGTVRLWRAGDLQPLAPYPLLRHGERVMHATFSPDGRLIITACTDGSVRVWDLAGADTFPVRKRGSFCRDGCRFLSVTNDSCRVFNTSDGRPVSPAIQAGLGMDDAQLSGDGKFVVTVSLLETEDNRCRRKVVVRRAEDGQPVGPEITFSNLLTSPAAVSSDGQRIALCTSNAVTIWDTLTATTVWPALTHQAQVSSALFNPGGDLLATVSGTNVQVWAMATGQAAYPPLPHPVLVDYAEFSRNGRYLVTCCSEPGLAKCSAQIWDARTGRAVCRALRHGDGVLSACFSRDAKRIATASEDFTARVWETASGSPIGLPLAHGNQVRAVSFNADGRWLATASADHTARVWDPDNTDPLTPPFQHLVALTDVKFLPDEQHLIVQDREGKAAIWPLHVERRPVPDLVQLAEFLSGVSISERAATEGADSLSETWQRLRARYPQTFSTSREEVLRWHESQAEQSEFEEQWPAAVFHLQCLLKAAGENASLPQRLAEAKAHLKKD